MHLTLPSDTPVWFTYEVPPCRSILGLSPACWPGHQYSVVLHPSQSCSLDQYGETVPQAGRHNHMGETFDPLCSQGCFQALKEEQQKKAVIF